MIIDAILRINPDAKVSVIDNDFDKIIWHDGTTPIPKTEIENKMEEIKTEYEANEYQRKREEEYPSIKDQLDDIYHNGIDGWKETIKAVKEKYPKE